jgi:Fis family transcriptional regulator, factor for inversion stimulation protein
MNQSNRTPYQKEIASTKDRLAGLTAELYESGIFYSEAVLQFKKQYITHALRSCNGNQVRAAKELAMHRNTLSRAIAELKLNRMDWDPRRQLAGRFPARMNGVKHERAA